nr:ribonuclease H-like domain-containing protein [Tanacetum cinerariifolium]
MADNHTMEEMLQAPTEGYGDAIVVPDILAENFKIKTSLLSLIQANTFHVQAVTATDDSPAIPEHTTVETPMNMSPANKAHFKSEKEAIHLILTGIRDEIYSTVDACQTAQEMWEAIERLQQARMVKFVTIVKQQHKLDKVSYHTLFDILKQYQKEVNELRAERLARNANPLALVATTQANQDPYYQTSKSQKSYAPSSKPSVPTRPHTTTRYKGKEIVKPITPPSESASEEDNDPEQAQMDKDMQNNLALIAKYFKKIYKPTNNNLRTSSNLRNKNVDTTSRYKNDSQSGQFGNQRMMNVAGARENVGSLVVQQSGKQCFNCKELGHFAKECIKPKRVKDFAYHKEKMLLCRQAKKDTGTDSEPLENVQNGTEYNVFSNDLQHFEQSESISNTCLVETNDSNVIPDSPDMCDDIQNDQNDVESDDERAALTNLIANLKLDTEFEKYKAFNDRTVDYDKLERKLNETLGQLAQKDIEIKEGLKLKAYEISLVKEKHDELIKQNLLTKSHYKGLVKKKTKQEMHADLEYVESLEKEIDELKSDKAELSNMYDMILQECVSNDVMSIYLLSLSDLDALAELQCLYLHKVKECDCLAQKLLKQTESVSKEVHTELLQCFAKVEKHSISFEIALQKCNEQLILITACVTKMLNDVNARTKKPNVVPISTRKPKVHANKSVAIPHKKKVASQSTTQKPKSYYRMLYEKSSKA